jgi:acyl-CoA synthetase (AMP-forming)/AMP-acid ligase II/acyl carrier protein
MMDKLEIGRMSAIYRLTQRYALQQEEKTAFTFLTGDAVSGTSLTYGALDRQARAIAARLADSHLKGERVLLLYPQGLEYIAALFGCFYAGAIAVPSYPPRINRANPQLQAIIADSQAAAALTITPFYSYLKNSFAETPELASLEWVTTDDLLIDWADNWKDPGILSHDLAFLQYTSGSTSKPKGVMVSHGNLMSNLEVISRCFHTDTDTRGVFWLPFYHDMGLIGGILGTVYCGCTSTLLSALDFSQRPLRWLQAISRTGATISGGPNFAYDLCVRLSKPEEREQLDLASWTLAFNGAEPVQSDTLEQFSAAFAGCGFKREAFYPCYGLAESTLLVSGGKIEAAPVIRIFKKEELTANQVVPAADDSKDRQVLVGCGEAAPGVHIAIVDPQTLKAAPVGTIGEIWAASGSVAGGYWNRPEETFYTFGKHLEEFGESKFLRTGDMGFLQDGELFITGRLKDLIIIRGRNHYPNDIEKTVERSHPAIESGCGAAFAVDKDGEERLVVVHEIKHSERDTELDSVIRTIRQSIAKEHELQVYAVALIRPKSIPRTSSGKIKRSTCKKQFLENDLKVIGKWVSDQKGSFEGRLPRPTLAVTYKAPQTEIETKLAEIWQEVLFIDSIGADDNFFELGADSLTAFQAFSRVREAFGLELQITDLFEQGNIASLAKYIAVVQWLTRDISTVPQKGRETLVI